MKKVPLVSVVITTYKREPRIVERAIQSVLAQSYKNIELIVVDDSPSSYELRNHIRNMVEMYDGKVRYIQHDKNMGACVARNTGLYASQGEYIAYLDDDDEWCHDKIEKQIKCFVNDKIALVYCGRIVQDDVNNIAKEYEVPEYEKDLYEKLLVKGNFIGSTSFPLIRKKCLEEIKGFDPLMESAQDADVWLRLAEKYEARGLNEALVIYHVHGEERITTNPQKKLNGIFRIYEKNKEFIDANAEAKARFYGMFAFIYASDGQLKNGLKYWWYSVRIRPVSCMKHLKCMCKILLNYYQYLLLKRIKK